MSHRPNILIIYPDQMRYDAMGCAGNPVIRTPQIDRLAAEGVQFTEAYTSYPICCPFRASMVTGEYAQSHGMIQNHFPLRGDQTFLAELLPENGITADNAQFIGLQRLDIPSSALSLKGLQGAWFATPSPALVQRFNNRYQAAYGNTPPPVAGLAYDGIAAIGALVAQGNANALTAGALGQVSQRCRAFTGEGCDRSRGWRWRRRCEVRKRAPGRGKFGDDRP